MTNLINVDLATVDSIVGYLSHDNINSMDDWTLHAATEITYALLMSQNIAFAPSPGVPGPKAQLFAELYNSLKYFFRFTTTKYSGNS